VAIAVKQTPGPARLTLASATYRPGPALAWPVLAFGIFFGLLSDVRFRSFNSDTYMTLTAGRDVAHHGLPGVERLTLGAAGHHWIDQQWLAQWIFFRAWQGGGNAGVALLAAALTAGAFALLTALLLFRGTTPGRALEWSVLAFAVALPDTGVRAQAFAYPLFVGLVWLLLRDREGRGSPIALLSAVALLVVWANLHGSVLLGAVLAAAYCGWQAVRRFGAERRASVFYAAVGVAALAALFATPRSPTTELSWRTRPSAAFPRNGSRHGRRRLPPSGSLSLSSRSPWFSGSRFDGAFGPTRSFSPPPRRCASPVSTRSAGKRGPQLSGSCSARIFSYEYRPRGRQGRRARARCSCSG